MVIGDVGQSATRGDRLRAQPLPGDVGGEGPTTAGTAARASSPARPPTPQCATPPAAGFVEPVFDYPHTPDPDLGGSEPLRDHRRLRRPRPRPRRPLRPLRLHRPLLGRGPRAAAADAGRRPRRRATARWGCSWTGRSPSAKTRRGGSTWSSRAAASTASRDCRRRPARRRCHRRRPAAKRGPRPNPPSSASRPSGAGSNAARWRC